MSEDDEFSKERRLNINRMANDVDLRTSCDNLMIQSIRHKYSYNFDWLGRPIIQYPEDILAMQEIVWKVKPTLIIETGVARGGSIVFYASLLELLGRGTVLGIDIDIRSHNYGEIINHPMGHRIQLIEGSSIAPETYQKVRAVAEEHHSVLVCLDSNHTEAHVTQELMLYSKLVSKGSYIVVFDTIIEKVPSELFSDRPWSIGNNPASAVKKFLESNPEFRRDDTYNKKLLLSVSPGGYLIRS